MNNQFIEMQKRFLLQHEEIEENGLLGEILVLTKQTFEDLANFAVMTQRSYINSDIMNVAGIQNELNLTNDLEDDIEKEAMSPVIPRIREVKKVEFALDNL